MLGLCDGRDFDKYRLSRVLRNKEDHVGRERGGGVREE